MYKYPSTNSKVDYSASHGVVSGQKGAAAPKKAEHGTKTAPNSVDQHILALLVKQDYMPVVKLP